MDSSNNIRYISNSISIYIHHTDNMNKLTEMDENRGLLHGGVWYRPDGDGGIQTT
jgi:hypothetical protein